MQDLALALERPAEQDEALIDERVHELRVLGESVLLAQPAGPVPGTAALECHGEQHLHAETICKSEAPASVWVACLCEETYSESEAR